MREYGLWALFVLLILENANVPIPSEPTLLYGGFLVYSNVVDLPDAIMVSVVGAMLGSWLSYALGAWGGREVLERWGRWVRITPHHLDKAHAWFDGKGSKSVLLGRMMPVVRTFISFPAGVARMNIWQFSIYTAIGASIWNSAWIGGGLALGESWEAAGGKAAHALQLVFFAAVAVGAVWGFRRWRRRRQRGSSAQGAGEA